MTSNLFSVSPWQILGDVIGWVVLLIVFMFATAIVWALIIGMVRTVRRKERAHRIMSSKDQESRVP